MSVPSPKPDGTAERRACRKCGEIVSLSDAYCPGCGCILDVSTTVLLAQPHPVSLVAHRFSLRWQALAALFAAGLHAVAALGAAALASSAFAAAAVAFAAGATACAFATGLAVSRWSGARRTIETTTAIAALVALETWVLHRTLHIEGTDLLIGSTVRLVFETPAAALGAVLGGRRPVG